MAAANRTVKTLGIALIVFVMLTFVLAVTTYLFFKQRMDEQLRREDAVKEANGLRENLLAAQGEVGKLREIIGVEPEQTIEQVETGFNEALQRDFSDFNRQPRSYVTLTAWLREQFRTWAAETSTADAKAKQAAAEAERKRQEADAAVAAARKEAEAAKQALTEQKQAFDERWKKHEKELSDLQAAKETAEQKVESFNLLVKQVAAAEELLPSEAQREFRSKPTEGRLDVVYRELRARRERIAEQNKLLDSLRVADRAVQQQVLAAVPADDRIDGFNGRVVSVDAGGKSAVLEFRSTNGMRPGLVLHAFDPGDPRPKISANKGELEVTSVESSKRARALIKRDSNRNPILAGDGVATTLWAGDKPLEIVIAGFVNLNDDAESDRDELVGLVQRTGAQVVDKVSPTTTFVVDAGKSPMSLTKTISAGDADGNVPADGQEQKAGETDKRRDRAIQDAKARGIPVIGIDRLLDELGIDRAAFDAGRLPRRTGGGIRPSAAR